MRKLTITTALLAVFISWGALLNAQTAKLQKARQELEALQYEQALNIYHKLHRKNNDFLPALEGLASCYQKTGDWAEAANWYAKALAQPSVDADVYFRYGQVLLQQDSCELAQAAFDQYLERKPYDERRTSIEQVCQYLEQLKTSNVERKASLLDFNGPDSDIAPAFYENGIVFGSVRSKSEKEPAYYGLYQTQATRENLPEGVKLTFSPIEEFSNSLNSEYNEAIISFSPDGREAYFTRNQDEAVSEKNPLRRLEIRMARLSRDSVWSIPVALHFNSISFNNAHPALSPDGEYLYFTSDRPGGFGGKDIYRCERIGLTWGAPINLGPQINTPGDELYPSYDASGKLYFASNGHIGLGGLDILRATDSGRGQWGNIENMGVPVNSPADDFGLIIDDSGDFGFFTSNREGGAGSDDVYLFQRQKISLQLQFTETNEMPLASAIPFNVKGQDYIHFSNKEGYWQYWLAPDECLVLQLQDERFERSSLEVCASASENQEELAVNWPIHKKSIAMPMYVAKAPGNYLLGTVIDELSGLPIGNATIKLRSSDCGKFINIKTDMDGKFGYPFSDECCYELTTIKEGYFAGDYKERICQATRIPDEGLRLNMMPYRLQETHEITTTSNTEDFAIGNKTYEDDDGAIPYLLNIYYDLGRSSVRAEALPELERLYDLLLRNPEIILEVSSHTDAQGGEKLNKNLSQRRASAIVKWLTNKGISNRRLVARGYGEERLVNGCKNGVDCSEEEHQLNRRTEFRVLDQELGQSN